MGIAQSHLQSGPCKLDPLADRTPSCAIESSIGFELDPLVDGTTSSTLESSIVVKRKRLSSGLFDIKLLDMEENNSNPNLPRRLSHPQCYTIVSGCLWQNITSIQPNHCSKNTYVVHVSGGSRSFLTGFWLFIKLNHSLIPPSY